MDPAFDVDIEHMPHILQVNPRLHRVALKKRDGLVRLGRNPS